MISNKKFEEIPWNEVDFINDSRWSIDFVENNSGKNSWILLKTIPTIDYSSDQIYSNQVEIYPLSNQISNILTKVYKMGKEAKTKEIKNALDIKI